MDLIAHHFWLIAGLLVIVPIVMMAFGIVSGGRQKIRFLKRYTESRGYRFENPEMAQIPNMSVIEMWKTLNFKSMKRGTDGLEGIPEFFVPSAASMGFMVDWDAKPMTVFAHTYSFKGNTPQNTSTFIHLKCAKVPCLSLPIFRLEKRGLTTAIEGFVEKLRHQQGLSSGLPPIELAGHPKFSAAFRLTAEDEAKTRAFLNDAVVSVLERTPPDGICATSLSYLVYFEHGQLTDEASYDDFIVRAKSALTCFV